MARTVNLEFDENELKLLLVAIRQVKHTFRIAEAQSREAGEQLASDYQPVQELYDRLERKLAAQISEQSPEPPFRIK